MSEGIDMSDGTVVAGANPFSPDWVRSELRCTKAGLRGQPTVLDLTRVVHNNGANFSKVGLSERAAGVAPLAAARGDADTSMFKAMEEASTASAAAVGMAAYKNAEGVRVLVGFGNLAALSLRERLQGVHARTRGPSARAGRGANTSRGGAGAGQQGQRHPRAAQESQEDATPAQQHESAKLQEANYWQPPPPRSREEQVRRAP